jgi:Tol biopolymer transport system component
MVFSGLEGVVRLVDINGANERTILSAVSSNFGVLPRFDPTRRRVTLHTASPQGGGTPDDLIVIDTTGTQRRDVGPAIGFSAIMATRLLPDGTVLVVGRRDLDLSHPDFSVWRVAADNTITFLAYIPDLGLSFGGADISHTGTRVAYAANAATFPPELYVLDIASGATTLIDANGNSPRWSAQDDRLSYLASGVAMVANADGTGRRSLGSGTFSEGLAWSPNGTYIVGHASEANALRVLRVADGAEVMAYFRSATAVRDYGQPDWR